MTTLFTAPTNDQPFDSLGLFTYLRTYARRHDESNPNSSVETWHECLSRVVNACNSQLNAGFTPEEQQEFFNLLYTLKCSVAGRFLWQLGTRTVDKLGLMSLQNCAFTVVDNPVKPFTWIMNFLMLGAGCGYRISQEDVSKFPIVKHVNITRRDEKDSDYIVPDSRQGWIKLLGKVMKAHFYSGECFTYSCHLLRSKGAPIKGFGGLSSGPEVLCDGIAKINTLLNAKAGQKITSVDALDIANIIGMIVVSGNVRRCLPAGALVHTDGGLVPIEKVVVGTNVLTPRGYKRVLNTFIQGTQQLVTIATREGQFKCTPNHKMAVWRSPTEYDWKEASQLVAGDELVASSMVSGGVKTHLPRDDSVKCIPELDEDMAWFIGLFQGCLGYTSKSEIRIVVPYDDGYVIANEVLNELARFGEPTTTMEVTQFGKFKSISIVCKDECLVRYFDTFIKGYDSRCSNVPEYILRSTPEIRLSYISGISDSVKTDDSIIILGYESFAREIQTMLYSCGIESSYMQYCDNVANLYSPSFYDKKKQNIGGIRPVVVQSVSVASTTEETFDIEVEDVHSFFCNGYLTHNSAQIALGDASDSEYMKAKRWDLVSIPNWRCYSNNSVICNDIAEIIDNEDFWAGYNGNGEPYGLVNLQLSKSCGRLGETHYPDPDVEGYNPCVTGDTWVMTDKGPRTVLSLYKEKGRVNVYVDGILHPTTDDGFYMTRVTRVCILTTYEGYRLRATPNHRIMTPNGWVPLEKLNEGDKVLLHTHRYISWDGPGTFNEGFDEAIDAMEMWIHKDDKTFESFESSSSEFCRGFLKGVFACSGYISKTLNGVLLHMNDLRHFKMVQRMLNRFGISSAVEQLKDLFLVIKQTRTFNQLINGDSIEYYASEPHVCTATVLTVNQDEIEPVYDCTVPSAGKFDANSFVVSNCAEQSLARWETCCLGEIYLPNIETFDELKKCATYLYRTCKHSLNLPCADSKETENIVHKNFRMGLGVTGYLQATDTQRNWLSDCYKYLREYDEAYSRANNFPPSVKLTTCKPSGTLSILGHCTSGVHPGFAQYYIRRIRVSSESKLIAVAKAHGYHVEYVQNFDGSLDYNTQVISFPYALPEGTILAENCTAVQQLEYVKRLQTEWSDNAVSVTVYYRKEELPEIKEWLRVNYNNSVKTVSFLLHSDHGFKQAPLEKISKEAYLEMVKNTRPITDISSICYTAADENFVGEGECAGGACPLK